MNLDTYATMCGVSVHALTEAKQPASSLKRLLLVFIQDSFELRYLSCVCFSHVYSGKCLYYKFHVNGEHLLYMSVIQYI